MVRCVSPTYATRVWTCRKLHGYVAFGIAWVAVQWTCLGFNVWSASWIWTRWKTDERTILWFIPLAMQIKKQRSDSTKKHPSSSTLSKTTNLQFFTMFSNYTWNFVHVVKEDHTKKCCFLRSIPTTNHAVAKVTKHRRRCLWAWLQDETCSSTAKSTNIEGSDLDFSVIVLRRTTWPSRSTGRGFVFIIGNFD